MLKKIKFIIFGLISIITTLTALEAPDLFMSRVTTEVISDINKLPTDRQPIQLYNIIEEKILPQVDVGYMAKWVIGRKAWGEANSVDKEAFTKLFTSLLTKTYSSTLLAFKDKKMDYYLNNKADYLKAKNIQVMCKIDQPNKDPINVMYQLKRSGDQWKIFDVLVEGVSMLKGLQAQFAESVSRGGIKAAIELVEKKLKSGDTNAS